MTGVQTCALPIWCSPPLPGSRDPGTTSPGERTARLGLLQRHDASDAAGSPRLLRTAPSPRLSEPEPLKQSERRTDALRRPTGRGGSKSKAEPRELREQRREREIPPSSLRSSGLKLHKQLDVPASVEYRNRQRTIPNSGGGLWEQDILIFPLFLFL